jgi:hypothetical protein
MKNIKYIMLFTMVLMLFVNSCTKLDENFFNQVPVSEFGKTQKELDALVGSIYPGMHVWQLDDPSLLTMTEISGGMAVIPRRGGDWWSNGAQKELTQHLYAPGSSMGYYGYLLTSDGKSGFWYSAYNNITLCNQLYALIKAGTGDEVLKNKTLAQIRGIRAFWYYLLVDNIGNVPLVTDFYDTSMPKTTVPGQRKKVYDFIMAELDTITNLLPPGGPSATYYGKFTKGASFAIRAKMYLNAMVWNPEAGTKWQQCINACDTLINMGYQLEPNWQTNFIPHNEVSREAIFSSVCKPGDDGNNVLRFSLHYLSQEALNIWVGPWNGICGMPNYIKAFDTINDIRCKESFLWGPMISLIDGKQIYTAENRPLIYSIDVPRHNMEDGWGSAYQEVGARCWKWVPEPGLSTSMENDYHIFRISDVYLMKAEALVRRDGGSNGEATSLVNAIRERAFPDMPSKLYSSVTLDDIMTERRFELAWEGYARQDKIRFGHFADPIPGWKDYTDPIDLFDNPAWFPSGHTHFDLFPIPEIVRNSNPNIMQNPGYAQ